MISSADRAGIRINNAIGRDHSHGRFADPPRDAGRAGAGHQPGAADVRPDRQRRQHLGLGGAQRMGPPPREAVANGQVGYYLGEQAAEGGYCGNAACTAAIRACNGAAGSAASQTTSSPNQLVPAKQQSKPGTDAHGSCWLASAPPPAVSLRKDLVPVRCAGSAPSRFSQIGAFPALPVDRKQD
jgi:hypothetical protein